MEPYHCLSAVVDCVEGAGRLGGGRVELLTCVSGRVRGADLEINYFDKMRREIGQMFSSRFNCYDEIQV